LVAAIVVLVGGGPRILLAAGSLSEWVRPFTWSDALFTYERGLSGHRLPYFDTPFEYPPLLGFVSGVFSLLASGPVTYVVLWTVLLAASAAWCAHLLREAGVRRSLLYWSFTPQLLLLGTVNFDVLPVTLLAAASVAQRSGRELTAAAALAAGTATKLFPLAAAPIAALRDRRRLAAVLTFITIVGSAYLVTWFAPNSSAGGIARYATEIPPNLDSLWGLVERALVVAGLPPVFVLGFTLAGLAATYGFHVLPRARRAADPAVGFALATIVLLFWSRLYSPQYSLWILPFFALLPIGGRAFALLSVADVGVFFTIYPLTLVRRGGDDAASVALLGALAAFVVLRQVAIVMTWRSVLRMIPR
jgi:hypothetical protein